MPQPYNYVTLTQAQAELSLRLFDTTFQQWTAAELTLYIQESLRTFQALSNFWRNDFVFPTVNAQTWYDLTTVANTLRSINVTDQQLYTIMEYHLLEPVTTNFPAVGQIWTGSKQFTIQDLMNAVQRRRDEVLSVSGCTITRRTVPAVPGRTSLPDSVIDIRRGAYAPSTFVGTLIQSSGGSSTLKFQRRVATFSAIGDQYIAIGTYLNLGTKPVTIQLIAGANVATATIQPGQQQNINLSILGNGATMNYQIITQNIGDSLVLLGVNPGAFDNTSAPGVNIFTGDSLQFVTFWSGQSGAVITLTQGILSPSTSISPLWMDDTWAEQAYENSYLQSPAGTPQIMSVSSQPPLSFDVDIQPSVPGNYELLTIEAGGALTVVAASTLLIPDDWTWVLKWGALADLFSRESNGKDELRAQYCEARYRQGLQLLTSSSALLAMRLNNVPLNIDSVYNADAFNQGWQGVAATKPDTALVSGLNLIALSPTPDAGPYSVTATVAQNAPIPSVGTDPVQVGRDEYDAVIGYAQHLAAFKMGGAEMMATAPLLERFLTAAQVYNSKLSQSGEFMKAIYGLSGLQKQANPERQTAASEG